MFGAVGTNGRARYTEFAPRGLPAEPAPPVIDCFRNEKRTAAARIDRARNQSRGGKGDGSKKFAQRRKGSGSSRDFETFRVSLCKIWPHQGREDWSDPENFTVRDRKGRENRSEGGESLMASPRKTSGKKPPKAAPAPSAAVIPFPCDRVARITEWAVRRVMAAPAEQRNAVATETCHLRWRRLVALGVSEQLATRDMNKLWFAIARKVNSAGWADHA